MSEKKTVYTIKPPLTLAGVALLPSSKSLSNRVLIIEALMRLQQGVLASSKVHYLAQCDDTYVMQRALSLPNKTEVDVMAAGTAMRFLTAYYACTPGEYTLTGTERMRQRPIGVLVDALRTLGADISYIDQEGFPPLSIRGKVLLGGNVCLPGHVSSQYISALLLIAPTLTKGLYLTLTGDIVSRSYIDMTLELMRQFGAKAFWESNNTIVVRPTGYFRQESYSVEGDWSAASYWYEIVALSPFSETRIELPRLYRNSLQGDSAVASYFSRLGVHTQWHSDGVTLTKQVCTATHFEVDLTLQPDIAQTLIVTLCAMGVSFRVSGLHTLRIKETDRIAALQTELAKLGYTLEEPTPGTLVWSGSQTAVTTTQPITIATYDDHRMAMAFAPFSLNPSVSIEIADPKVVTKSYPEFWEALRQVGFICTDTL